MSDLFDKSIRTLELPRVLELLSEQAVSAEAKQRALRLRPETEPEEVLRLLEAQGYTRIHARRGKTLEVVQDRFRLSGAERARVVEALEAALRVGQGRVAIVRTKGNPYGHIVLRGGDGRPNYDTVSISMVEQVLAKAKLPHNIVVDCSHANSFKKPELQPLVMADIVNQIRLGNKSLVGVMIESNIEAGNQPIPADLSQLKYGCSVTDACVGWDTTEEMIRNTDAMLRDVIGKRERRA